MDNRLKLLFLLILSIWLVSCGKQSSEMGKNSPEFVACSESDGWSKYKKGCIPFGEHHFCSLLSESIKSGKFLNFMSGVWLDSFDPHGLFTYSINSLGVINQYEGSSVIGTWKEITQPNYNFPKAKIAKIGHISLKKDTIKIEGIWIRGEKRKFIADETVDKIVCYVGFPDQIELRIIPEIAFLPYTETYYEPIHVEIKYPSGEMREIK